MSFVGVADMTRRLEIFVGFRVLGLGFRVFRVWGG